MKKILLVILMCVSLVSFVFSYERPLEPFELREKAEELESIATELIAIAERLRKLNFGYEGWADHFQGVATNFRERADQLRWRANRIELDRR